MDLLRYLGALLRHKWFVFVEACKLGIPFLGIIHDWSKFLPSEFIPYARYFYGIGSKKKFNEAWLHHQHRNKHHWQRWMLTLDSASSDGKIHALPMPDRYRREMLADWHGAGRAYGSPTKKWYRQNKDQIHLHRETREWIEKMIYG